MARPHKGNGINLIHELMSRKGQEWRKEALCHRFPLEDYSELWFPPRSAKEAPAAAKTICGQCPVRRQCMVFGLKHALVPGEDDTGVWGGYLGKELKAMFPDGNIPGSFI